MSVKYQLTQNTIEYKGQMLYQIQALKDIPEIDVQAGDFGGYIANESNLSQQGNCWVRYLNKRHYGIVCENARVIENADIGNGVRVEGEAEISGNVELFASPFSDGVLISNCAKITGKNLLIRARSRSSVMISGNVEINGDGVEICADNGYGLFIGGNVKVYEQAQVIGDCQLFDNAQLYGKAKLIDSTAKDNAQIFGEALVSNNSLILGNAKIFGNTEIRNATIFDSD
ncbi:hypothetical protein A1D22_06930 [Pasteurellaceae bacterium LFhippo2]|nr:hypothetical protein [Pasteurellaceae bacterium LFhippo2]